MPALDGRDELHRHAQPAGDRPAARARPQDAVLPGLDVRDVRQSPGSPADGDHPFLPQVAVRRGQAGRPLAGQELPRVVRALRVLRHPLQPRVAPPRARVRHPENCQGRPRPDDGQPGRPGDWQPGRPARLGPRQRLRRGDVADAPAAGAGRLRDRDRRAAQRPGVRGDCFQEVRGGRYHVGRRRPGRGGPGRHDGYNSGPRVGEILPAVRGGHAGG